MAPMNMMGGHGGPRGGRFGGGGHGGPGRKPTRENPNSVQINKENAKFASQIRALLEKWK